MFSQKVVQRTMKIDLSQVKLTTERLHLRHWQKSDVQDYYDYASVPGVGEAAGWYHHTDINHTKRLIDQLIRRKSSIAIVYRENNKLIGSLSLHNSEYSSATISRRERGLDVGYSLSKDYWGHGLVPEALRAFIDYLFIDMDLDYIMARVLPTNNRSIRVLEKCGFIHDGEMKQASLEGIFVDYNVYILDVSTWYSLRKEDSN